MGNHLIGFFQSVDSASLTEINTLVDDVLTRTGATRYLVPAEYNQVLWGAALGANVTRAQIFSPSLEVRRENVELVPRRRGAAAFSLGFPEIWIPGRPIPMIPTEEISARVAEDAAGASTVYSIIALGPPQLPQMPNGEIRHVRATGTTTLTANAWTTCALTLDSALEPGEYALVGWKAISAGAIAARAIITGQVWRPGLPALAGTEAAAVDHNPTLLDDLMFMNFGIFTHVNIPQFQFLSASADTAETLILYIIKVG